MTKWYGITVKDYKYFAVEVADSEGYTEAKKCISSGEIINSVQMQTASGLKVLYSPKAKAIKLLKESGLLNEMGKPTELLKALDNPTRTTILSK